MLRSGTATSCRFSLAYVCDETVHDKIKDEMGPLRACQINGKRVEGRWSSSQKLSRILRKNLGLCAIKEGCDNGRCGSCTILVDGEPVPACQETWSTVEGKSVSTPEGISAEMRSKYAKAFAQVGMACGFCIPGMAMRLHRLFEQHPTPSRSILQAAMAEHFCRCSGYQGWLESFQQLMRPKQPPAQVTLQENQGPTQVSRFNESGCGQPAMERLLSGEPVFVDDVPLEEDALEGALAFTSEAWGSLRFVDTTQASFCPGVCSIITSDDIDKLNAEEPAPDEDTIPNIPTLYASDSKSPDSEQSDALFDTVSSSLFESEDALFDEDLSSLPRANQEEASALLNEALAFWEDAGGDTPSSVEHWSTDEAAFVQGAKHPWLARRDEWIQSWGDVVALITAKEREQARKAARKVRVVLDDVDPQFDAEYAFQRGCARRVVHHKISRGDIEQAFRDAHTIVSGTWTTSPVDAAVLELPVCIAEPLKEGRVRITTSGAKPADVQAHVAQVLDRPLEDVEVHVLPAGGSFGARNAPLIEGFAALMAVREARTVKLALSRDDAARVLPKRHAMRIHATLACDERGHFIGLRMHIFADTGGRSAHAIEVLQQALVHACGPYRITAYQLEADAVCSNNPSAGEMRAAGVTQVAFALEGVIDMLSKRIQMDGWALRYRNALQPGDRLPNGQFLGEDCNIAQTLEAIRDVFYKHGDVAGLACAFKGSGIWHSPSKSRDVRVQIRVDNPEAFTLLLPCVETGQGLHALLVQAAAETSRFSASCFSIEVSSIISEKLDFPTLEGSTSAMIEAMKDAAEALRKAASNGALKVGRIFEGARAFGVTEDEPAVHPDLPRYLSFGYVAQVVVIDQNTGRIRKVVTACDAGRPIDTAGLVMQVEGAVHMGLGFALSEGLELIEGQPQEVQLDQLGVLEPQHLPYMQVIVLSECKHTGHRESKSAGELAMIPIAPAVAAALFRREGIRYFALPMRSSVTAAAHLPALAERSTRKR